MAELKTKYKFGLYGRCPSCKDISQEICDGCGATEAFTDSSKPGVVLCTECGLEHSIACTKPGCSGQIKVLRTPKNTDEKGRIDEFIYRKKNKDMDKRIFTIKESPKVTVVKEMKVPVEEYNKKEREGVISLNSEVDFEILDLSKTEPVKEKKAEKKAESKDVPAAEKPQPKITIDKNEPEISLKKESEKLQAETTVASREPTPEEKQELDKIKNFWKSRELTEKEEKKEQERRIVNQFYDEQDDDALDKKINFENIYNETAYFDCRVCGTEEQKIVCDKCGQSNQFSLNYDALSCKCGNDTKVKTCNCGAKHGHSDFYLVSDGIKWQYSKSKSYYNYRKGRMLVFSTCPTCNVFSVEKCKVCGSKVNFGFPNKNNEIYCKNCGTVNQFICENRNCNDSVKALKNPNSIEQKLEWLNEVMNFKDRVKTEKVKYSEPGAPKREMIKSASNAEISLGGDSTPDFTDSFIEDFDNKTKELITTSFISEVENEVNQRKKLQDELRNYNKTQAGQPSPKPSFGTPAGSKVAAPAVSLAGDDDQSPAPGINFDDSGKGIKFYIIIAVTAAVLIAAAWWGFASFSGGSKDPGEKTEVVPPTPAAAEPKTPKAGE